ncbi:hypothetical protein C8F01DRAFT_1078486 [Mycena amicta]|nr:hypothetical protein C8F01DRAFT_1078486 [Mycena amicta]
MLLCERDGGWIQRQCRDGQPQSRLPTDWAASAIKPSSKARLSSFLTKVHTPYDPGPSTLLEAVKTDFSMSSQPPHGKLLPNRCVALEQLPHLQDVPYLSQVVVITGFRELARHSIHPGDFGCDLGKLAAIDVEIRPYFATGRSYPYSAVTVLQKLYSIRLTTGIKGDICTFMQCIRPENPPNGTNTDNTGRCTHIDGTARPVKVGRKSTTVQEKPVPYRL